MQIQLKQAYSFKQQGHRPYQEDARFPDSDQPGGRFFIVCDGVGGQAYGEEASKRVSLALGKQMSLLSASDVLSNERFSKMLGATYDALQSNLTEKMKQMATTLTFVAFHPEGCMVAHLGDSRVYQLRPGAGVIFKTEDHSLVMELLRSGQLTPEEAKNYPLSNVITRCLSAGASKRYPATINNLTDVQSGDYFLLCTDGVLHCLDDEALQDIILSDKSDEEKCREMAHRCVDSSDNNTAILVPVDSVLENMDAIDENEETEDADQEEDTLRIYKKTSEAEEVDPLVSRNISYYINKVRNWLPGADKE